MGGLPYRVNFHVHHLEPLPDPEINRAGQKRVGVQLHQLDTGFNRTRFQGVVERARHP